MITKDSVFPGPGLRLYEFNVLPFGSTGGHVRSNVLLITT